VSVSPPELLPLIKIGERPPTVVVIAKQDRRALPAVVLSCDADRLFIQKRTDEQFRGVAIGIADQLAAASGNAVLHQDLPQ